MPVTYGTVVITLDNILLPKDKMTTTSPSAQDGLDEETETDLRITGCELIQTSGILLKLPQTAMATGQVLFQRFYFYKSFIRQSMETTAMACVYLASKIEEAPRRIRDVINVFHHIKQFRAGKQIQPLLLDPAYIKLKSDITLAERRILKELGFSVHVKHPHKLIVIYMQQLGYGKETKFVQKAWNYMNDALRTKVFVEHTPEAIACACIYLSARDMNISLPAEWFIVFDKTEDELIQISEEIVALYERGQINFEKMEKKVQAVVQAYQESKQQNKSTLDKTTPEVMAVTPEPVKVEPEPTVSVPKQEVTDSNSNKEVKEKEAPEKKPEENINGNHRRRREEDAGTHKSPPKRSRRTPSPIVYHESPYSRHKLKKRKKTMSRGRSRSPHERKSFKKTWRRDGRDRSESPDSARKHHKRKYHHR